MFEIIICAAVGIALVGVSGHAGAWLIELLDWEGIEMCHTGNCKWEHGLNGDICARPKDGACYLEGDLEEEAAPKPELSESSIKWLKRNL